MPLLYREYEGNRHDSKIFNRILEEVFEAIQGLGRFKAELAVVFDKGINAGANIADVDEKTGLDLITTYSTYLAQEPAETSLERFNPLDTAKNRALKAEGREEIFFHFIDPFTGFNVRNNQAKQGRDHGHLEMCKGGRLFSAWVKKDTRQVVSLLSEGKSILTMGLCEERARDVAGMVL